MECYRNTTFALIDGLEEALALPEEVVVRGFGVREVRNRGFTLERPLERVVVVPHRRSSVFAAIAETMWVLGGRNDVEFLQPYLPSARVYSDDGITWRGAYGPRLRNWDGIDQLRMCLDLIAEETSTRRAVMSLFDPGRDFVLSKDIPCNNWIHWLVRDGRMHMAIAVRSNDMFWGFSGINAFEWSVLHELMALWSTVDVGDATYFATSFHLYGRHYDRGRNIIRDFVGRTCYDWGLESPRATTLFDDFDSILNEWFDLEACIRLAPDSVRDEVLAFPDPLFRHFLMILRLAHGVRLGWSISRAMDELSLIGESDLTAAAYEFLTRDAAAEPPISHRRTRAFWKECFEGETVTEWYSDVDLRGAIAALHAEKSAAYGDSWKKRGEQVSILANVARKVDRLSQTVAGAAATKDESLLDTAIDLLVYTLKYQTYLADVDAEARVRLFGHGTEGESLSDGTVGLDALLYSLPPIVGYGEVPDLVEVARQVSLSFDDLEKLVSSGCDILAKLNSVNALVAWSSRAVWASCAKVPRIARKFVRESGAGGVA